MKFRTKSPIACGSGSARRISQSCDRSSKRRRNDPDIMEVLTGSPERFPVTPGTDLPECWNSCRIRNNQWFTLNWAIARPENREGAPSIASVAMFPSFRFDACAEMRALVGRGAVGKLPVTRWACRKTGILMSSLRTNPDERKPPTRHNEQHVEIFQSSKLSFLS